MLIKAVPELQFNLKKFPLYQMIFFDYPPKFVNMHPKLEYFGNTEDLT